MGKGTPQYCVRLCRRFHRVEEEHDPIIRKIIPEAFFSDFNVFLGLPGPREFWNQAPGTPGIDLKWNFKILKFSKKNEIPENFEMGPNGAHGASYGAPGPWGPFKVSQRPQLGFFWPIFWRKLTQNDTKWHKLTQIPTQIHTNWHLFVVHGFSSWTFMVESNEI